MSKFAASSPSFEFSIGWPELAVELSVGNRQQVFELLAHRRTDLAIAGQPPETIDCVATAFLENPLIVIAAAEHPLAGRKRIGLPELTHEAFVLREPGSGTRAAVLRHLAAASLEPRVAAELPTVEAVKQAVQAGLGLGVVSAQSVELELQAGRLVRLAVAGFPLIRSWYVIHGSEQALAPAARAFRDQLIAMFQRTGRPTGKAPGGSVAPS